MIGTLLDGKYRVGRLLGAGAMGEVYEATQIDLDRRVAIKVMRTSLPRPGLLARFEREAFAVARLRHPNIVTIYDFVKWSEDGAYLVMEYLEGRSLAEVVEERGRFGAEEAVRLIEPLCAALQAAHDAGVLHRDLKPQNLFVEENSAREQLKILDFGVVKLRDWREDDDATAAGEIVGTPIYMAPEQAAADDVDNRADVYALGAVLYETIVGQPPHVAASIAGLVMRKLTRRPRAMSERVEGVPAGLDDVVLRALEANRDNRYASAREFGEALRGVLSDRDETVHQPPLQPVALPTSARLRGRPEVISRFVGRKDEIEAVVSLLGTSRLVTLAGPGGIGKTRLALEASDVFEADFDAAVQFVGLAGVSDQRLVLATVAAAMDIRESSTRSTETCLAEALANRPTLLVLDNCEHVVEAAANLVASLLSRDGNVRVLATSREALGVDGEAIWRVGPLPIPPDGGAATLETLAECASVRLFVDRARLVKPGFALTERNAVAVATLCRELEGIPLAVELASALVRVLPADEIVARMDDRFRLLATGQRVSSGKAKALRTTLDWSYELLTDEERILLCCLSVFRGGFSLEAVEEVVARISGDLRHATIDLLTRLVDKSLVTVATLEGESRYGMLETIRQYARERLSDSRSAKSALTAHMDWCLALAERASGELHGPRQAEWYKRLDLEYPNLRAGLAHAIDVANDAETALALVGLLAVYWDVRGLRMEGAQWFAAALALEGGSAANRARALYGDAIALVEEWIGANGPGS